MVPSIRLKCSKMHLCEKTQNSLPALQTGKAHAHFHHLPWTPVHCSHAPPRYGVQHMVQCLLPLCGPWSCGRLTLLASLP